MRVFVSKALRLWPRGGSCLMAVVMWAVVVLGVTKPVRAQCSPSFAPTVNYAAGGGSFAVAVGDFNRDGKPDLAVTSAFSNSVSIHLGNAAPNSGTFQPAVYYVIGAYPRSVAVGDFDQDGRLDLAVANEGSFTVSILLGNGDGTFHASDSPSFAAHLHPAFVAVGHFNADGFLDLVVVNEFSDDVSILLGNGNGTFRSVVNYAVVGTGSTGAAVGDFNRDGKIDLAVASYNSNISVLLGNGDGTFQPAIFYPAGAGPYSVAVGDFNGDGKPDLAVANYTSNNVSVLLNQQLHVAHNSPDRAAN